MNQENIKELIELSAKLDAHKNLVTYLTTGISALSAVCSFLWFKYESSIKEYLNHLKKNESS